MKDLEPPNVELRSTKKKTECIKKYLCSKLEPLLYRYKIQPRKADAEQALANNDFDPFQMRDNEHPTT